LDKYAIISIFILILLCVWHAIIGAIVFIETHEIHMQSTNVYVRIDRWLFLAFCSIYCLMHLMMIIWFYKVPFGIRRQMKQRDFYYRNQLKLQTHSISCSMSNKNPREKYSILNMIIKDESQTMRDGFAKV